MSAALVSVVIPSYNFAHFVTEAVDSAWASCAAVVPGSKRTSTCPGTLSAAEGDPTNIRCALAPEAGTWSTSAALEIGWTNCATEILPRGSRTID